MTTSNSNSRVVSIMLAVIFVSMATLPVRAEASAGPLYAGGDFAWAKSLGGINDESGPYIAADSNGNVYSVGGFRGTADFDPGAGVFNLTTGDDVDLFISKLDRNGNFVWAKLLIDGTIYAAGTGITIDSSGNVYTTGTFNGTADFDPGAGTFNMIGGADGSNGEIFISKLDNNGNFVWARKLGTGDSHAIAIDPSGNVYTTGFGSGDFDPGAGVFNLTSAGSNDIFVSKLDSSGTFVWAKGMGGTGADDAWGIAIDLNGDVYASGTFEDTADFDPSAGTFNLTSVGNTDVFLFKLDSSGNFVWATSAGGAGFDYGLSVALDTHGNVYTAGTFVGTADFDPGAGVANLTSVGSRDVFLSKVDSNGNFLWAKSMGGLDTEQGGFVALDTNDNIYISGSFYGTADFDPGAGTFNLTSAGFSDLFIAKLDNNGTFVWAKGMGGVDFPDEYGLSIALDASDNVYTGGNFSGTVDLDPGPGTYTLTSAGGRDVFISKLQRDGVFGDVLSDYWALDFIERLYSAGITGGCNLTPLQYCPETTVTRAQ